MGIPDGVLIGRAQGSEQLRKLASSGFMHALQQSPVSTHRQQEVIIIGQPIGPVPTDNPHGQVLIDDDQRRRALGFQASSWS